MKTPNTPENKAAFMAMYCWQIIFFPDNHKFDNPLMVAPQDLDYRMVGFGGHLQLRSIESLTDEEAIEVSKVQFGFFKECAGGKDFNLKVVRELGKISVAAVTDYGKNCLAKIEINNEWKLNVCGIDYLRSISIALPWRDLSVEDLISYNWIKL